MSSDGGAAHLSARGRQKGANTAAWFRTLMIAKEVRIAAIFSVAIRQRAEAAFEQRTT
jgi:hypothetical protein